MAVYGSGVTEEAAQTRVEAGVNPVTQPIRLGGDAHPANSGFLVFVERNLTLAANESEGTMAAGGNLVIRANNYQVAVHSPAPTFKAEGDSGYTYLFVGGGVVWENPNSQVRIENQGFTKIADTSTFTVHVKDSNGATQPYRIVKKDAKYESQPLIEGRSRDQSAESVGTPVPRSVIDTAEAFKAYRQSSASMGGCAETVTLRTANGETLARPVTGGQAYLNLEPNTTNVLNLTVAELAAMSELSFRTKPTASGPLLVNVTGGSFTGRTPNTPGIGGADAPFILWNFPDATVVQVNNGATLEGTLFAPNADVSWQAGQNIEGNVIAQQFTHAGGGSEVHDFAFNAELQCSTDPEESPTATEPTETEPTETEPTETEPTKTEPTETEPTDEQSSSETPSESPTSTQTAERPVQTGSPEEPDETQSSSASVVSVNSEEPKDGNGFLPNTGATHPWAIVVAVVLLVAGTVLLIWERRTKRAEAEQSETVDSDSE